MSQSLSPPLRHLVGLQLVMCQSKGLTTCQFQYPLFCMVTEVENDVTVDVEDLTLEGIKAALNLDCQSGLNKADAFQTIMDEISTLSVTSVCHIPSCVRPLFAEIPSFEFNRR